MRLVLLHALPFDARMWDTARPVLAHALVPNLYNLGQTIEEWAAAILDQCASEELVVVGSSIGGSCALEIARASPDQVRGIVLIGAKASVRPDPTFRDAAVRVLENEGLDGAWRKYWAPLFGRDTDAAVTTAAYRIAMEQSVDDVIRGVRAFHDRRDLTKFISTWRRRLVVISGAEDRTPTPTDAAASIEGAVGYGLVVVENCGHYVGLERPDIVDAVITDQRG